MPTRFTRDVEVDAIGDGRLLDDWRKLLSLLCGRDLNLVETAPQKRVLDEILNKPPGQGPCLAWEQLNEILLLFGENRIREDFYYEFLNPSRKECISFAELREGVKRFRGFALLCFGSFRYCFNYLNQEARGVSCRAKLGQWGQETGELTSNFAKRPDPILEINAKTTLISESETWHLGYLTTTGLHHDLAYLHVLEAKAQGESREAREAKVERDVAVHLGLYWDQVEAEAVELWRGKVSELLSNGKRIYDRASDNRTKGSENTIKYLTWDFLDVYVATSMRETWEFVETFRVTSRVFEELRDLKLRWFDPTQSFEASPVDKGLLEGLMLKRAQCTIYFAQEGDTLGKDSELAATLAQGKPVVVYVQRITDDKLLEFVAKIAERPVRYFEQRLLQLEAQGFFDRADNIAEVSRKLDFIGSSAVGSSITSQVEDLLSTFRRFEPTFRLISREEEEFKAQNSEVVARAAELLGACEAHAADGRAALFSTYHPLGMQMHLDTGVANGVLVARTPLECAQLIRGILLNEMDFEIDFIGSLENRVGVALYETITRNRSKFRVVTHNELLTHSFWNYYLRKEGREA